MKMKKLLQTLLGALVLGLGLANAGFTQEPVKIGMVNYDFHLLRNQQRQGFLAVI